MTDRREPAAARWPAVAPEVVAEVVSALSERLRKRLDGAAAKLADREPVRAGDEWRVRIDEETELVLHAPAGVVRTAGDVRCGCLLAPGCLHRAAAVTFAPLAEDTAPEPGQPERPEPSGRREETGPEPVAEPLTEAELAAVHRLRLTAAHALAAGIGGAGSVLQAELLRTAHRARLLGLHRPAALATTVVTRLRAARSGAPGHRLADLVAAHRELLDAVTAGPADPDTLRGTARQSYREAGSLRLYGLFAEPVVTATHAGVTVWTVDADGALATVSDVLPHADPAEAAQLARAAAGRPVRLGDASLAHRELARAGLVVQGATRTVSGRLGAGAKVRAAGASGADWSAEPVARLWAEPVGAQVERALRADRTPAELRPAGAELLFLDVTVLGPGTVPGVAAPQLLADCAGRTVALLPALDHPRLAYGANLALLAGAPGLRLRVVGRLERAAHPRLRLLAAAPGPESGLALRPEYRERISLGLEQLQQADLPPAGGPVPVPAGLPPQPPLHLLSRPLEQAVTTGRDGLAARLAAGATEGPRLRAVGFATAEHLLAALRAAAADQERDVFGRLRTDDRLAYATAWSTAATYAEELATALCAAAWHREEEGV
ncbi:hypothetical protein ACIQBJ_05220 [Kitasatospora sp. NPDC088391]|uniref:hypothetical protein n=1 Tax=Kitasatospora sp. NPDC088391 TaxID=3364074 RepID=UPI00381DF52D